MQFDCPSRITTVAWYVLLLAGLPVAVALALLSDQPLPLAEWFPVIAAAVPAVLLLFALLSRFVVSRVQFDPEKRTVHSAVVVFGLPVRRSGFYRFDEIDRIDIESNRSGDEQVKITLADGSRLTVVPTRESEEVATQLRELIQGRPPAEAGNTEKPGS